MKVWAVLILSQSERGEANDFSWTKRASNTTNGLYPIRNGVVIKIDEDSKKVFIAPGWEYLSDNYQIAFDIKDSDMTDTYAIFQKFTDQGISADFYQKYTKDDNAVSFKDIFHKMGLKSRYYINSASGVDVSSSTIKEPEEQKGCDGGFCTLWAFLIKQIQNG